MPYRRLIDSPSGGAVHRERAQPLKEVTSISRLQHQRLLQRGAKNHKFWSTKSKLFLPLVAKFKEEIKNHHLFHQRGMCCYCSTELLPHGRTFDAEHILDKSTFPEFMFDLENFAVACVLCNTHKSAKAVLKRKAPRPASIPRRSRDYTIVHPHLDEWDEYLFIDSIGRIKSRPDKKKGEETIRVCGLDALNFYRLAMEFSPSVRQDAYKLMNHLLTLRDKARLEEALDLLDKLAGKVAVARTVAGSIRRALTKGA